MKITPKDILMAVPLVIVGTVLCGLIVVLIWIDWRGVVALVCVIGLIMGLAVSFVASLDYFHERTRK